MKKIALVIVMVFAFSLTQAGNHAVVNAIANHDATLQATTLAIQNTKMQAAPVFNMVAAETTVSHQHANKTKQPKADKKPKVKKEKQHKTEAERKAEHQKKEKARKADHQKKENGEHHHHKKADKK